MVAAGLSEIAVTVHQTARCHDPEYQHFKVTVTECIKKLSDEYRSTFFFSPVYSARAALQ
jgi:hypothetical protein